MKSFYNTGRCGTEKHTAEMIRSFAKGIRESVRDGLQIDDGLRHKTDVVLPIEDLLTEAVAAVDVRLTEQVESGLSIDDRVQQIGGLDPIDDRVSDGLTNGLVIK